MVGGFVRLRRNVFYFVASAAIQRLFREELSPLLMDLLHKRYGMVFDE
jgi:hypothetical protein